MSTQTEQATHEANIKTFIARIVRNSCFIKSAIWQYSYTQSRNKKTPQNCGVLVSLSTDFIILNTTQGIARSTSIAGISP